MAGNQKFPIDIVADDKTDKGLGSAEKRAQKFSSAQDKQRKLAERADAKAAAEGKRRDDKLFKEKLDRQKATGLGATGKGLSASERAFGGGAVSSAVGGGLSNLAEAGGTLRTAFAAASHESAGLAEKLGAAAAAGGVVVGAFVAAGLAVQKLASNWAESGSLSARTAQNIGVSSEDLQSFQGAGERVGVDKSASADALHGIAFTLHEAQSGRDQTALAAMNRMDIAPDYDKDGNADVLGFARKLADVIQRQKQPQTGEKIASIFGAGGAINLLRQGSSGIDSRMADVKRYGAVSPNSDAAAQMSLYEKQVQAQQLAERAAMVAGRSTAGAYGAGLDAFNTAGRSLSDGSLASNAASGFSSWGKDATHFAHALADGATPAAEKFTSAMDGAIDRLTNRRTLGGRLNNLGNLRGTDGAFRKFDTPAESLIAMGRQIVRDQDVHGAQTLSDLYAGTPGKDGKRHWGYAPASDGNDPAAYARYVGDKTGIGGGRFNAHDPQQLAAMIAAGVMRETGSKITAAQALPYAQRIILELHGMPAGSKVVARNARGGNGVAVAHAMSGNGP